jgi:hypothetical protein
VLPVDDPVRFRVVMVGVLMFVAVVVMMSACP